MNLICFLNLYDPKIRLSSRSDCILAVNVPSLLTAVKIFLTNCIDRFLFLFKLLDKKKNVQLKDMGEDLECLCQIMKTVGPKLDHEKARVSMRKTTRQ